MRSKNLLKIIIGEIIFFTQVSVYAIGNSEYTTDEPLEDGTSTGTETDTTINSGGEKMYLNDLVLIGSFGNPLDGEYGSTSLGEPQIKTGIQGYDSLRPSTSSALVIDRPDSTTGSDIDSRTETNPENLYGRWSGFIDKESSIKHYYYTYTTNIDNVTNKPEKNSSSWENAWNGPTTNTFGTIVRPTLEIGKIYYFCVVAVNTAGFFSIPVCSDGSGREFISLSLDKESINFNVIPTDTEPVSEQNSITIFTNTSTGYEMSLQKNQDPTHTNGVDKILDTFSGTISSPVPYSGYGLGFSLSGTYAESKWANGSNYSVIPSSSQVFNTWTGTIVDSATHTYQVNYKLDVADDQLFGDYSTSLTYIATMI